MITYKPQADDSIRVLLDGKLIGTIRRFATGWQYRPRGYEPGQMVPTLEDCKRRCEAGLL